MFWKKSRKTFLFCSFLLGVFCMSFAAAEDVAYIYRKDFSVDENILDVFSEMSLSVKLINEKNLPKDFSAAPLTITKGEENIQVYETAFKKRKVSVPYYFLPNKHRAEGLVSVATTKKNSGNRLGDVISYAPKGITLKNGKLVNEKICFFGIAASDCWTEETRELFKECIGYVWSEEANCERDSDCGSDEFVGETFCEGDDVARMFKEFKCRHPGTSQSACSSTEEMKIVQTCADGCSGGACIQTSDLIHNVALVNVTNSVGQIRIQDSEGGEVLLGESLQCNEKYKIIVRAKNLGNYSEFVYFEGSVGDLEVTHGDVEELLPGKTSDRTKTINFTLTEGSYLLNIEAIIDGATDANQFDNVAQREIQILCDGQPVSCTNDEDCGTDGFVGNNFCLGNDVGRKYKIYSCDGSSCSSTEEDRVFQTCATGCAGGECASSSSLVHDAALVNVTNAAGMIRIKDANNYDVPSGTALQCNQKYKIIIKPKNLGNYTENITFAGNVGSLEIDYSPAVLEAGKAGSTKTKTLNFTLAAGTYNMQIEALLEGANDINPLNNIATKQIVVVC